ncbi:hypothetical protein G5I_14560 [Acromyrmex echinatior]|uniref:Uncharacterized protein n=1 Tax=Acromyrmex echinatior TaxID=103372 RepID=F4X824_ACREC|nr:hypothetical protein G5I_14560 [Acromyrmex echinatior]
MAPILVLALVVLLVCNRGGGNVVLCPTGSHRHAATVPIYLRTYSTTRGVALPGRQRHSINVLLDASIHSARLSAARLQYETISGVLDLDDCGVCHVPGIRQGNVRSVVVNAAAVKQQPPPPPPPPPPPQQQLVEKDATSWTQFHLNSKI